MRGAWLMGLAGALLMAGGVAAVYAGTPAAVTVAPGQSAGWQGDSLAGQGDVPVPAQPLPQCTAGQCDDELVHLLGGGAANSVLSLVATINFDASSATFDLYVMDTTRNVLASATLNSTSPVSATADNLTPGDYIVEVDAEQGTPASYTGAVSAAATARPTLPSSLAFEPATVVSPTFLGAEPQVNVERPLGGAPAGATDPSRIFVDWPLGSGVQIGQLSRSTDGGASFRLLYDPTCAARSRPMCTTSGGGDTVARVNRYDGTVFFADQEEVANEAFASSTDHGDTFPATRATPLSNPTSAVDRQWIVAVDAPGSQYQLVTGQQIRALFSYHNPAADVVVQGVDQNGLLIPQPAPQVPFVGQSGPPRVDTTGGPGNGYVYLPFRDNSPSTQGGLASAFRVAAAPVLQYQNPTAWTVETVSADFPESFPWINLDSHGNLYAVWVDSGGVTWFASSSIDLPANNPRLGGHPASVWTPKVRVSPTSLGSTYFAAITAGDPGRVAIAYMGSPDFKGAPNGGQAAARWYTFLAESTNALSSTPRFATGTVSHHPDHTGAICTTGTTCAADTGPSGDRSLADMIDVAVDSNGRPGVVFMNNDNQEARDTGSTGQLGDPFVKFAKLASGVSLFGSGSVSLPAASGSVSIAPGRATWPSTAGGKDEAALDELGAALTSDGKGDVVARIDLADASTAAAVKAISDTGAAAGAGQVVQRLSYVMRWETQSDVQYLAMDVDSAGNRTFYGGTLNGSAALADPFEATAKRATGYPATSIPVVGTVSGHSIYISGRIADLGTQPRTPVFSATAFAMAGPSSSLETMATPMRVVDATPPFDGLAAAPPPAEVVTQLSHELGLLLSGSTKRVLPAHPPAAAPGPSAPKGGSGGAPNRPARAHPAAVAAHTGVPAALPIGGSLLLLLVGLGGWFLLAGRRRRSDEESPP